jgi:hypothetical protein
VKSLPEKSGKEKLGAVWLRVTRGIDDPFLIMRVLSPVLAGYCRFPELPGILSGFEDYIVEGFAR